MVLQRSTLLLCLALLSNGVLAQDTGLGQEEQDVFDQLELADSQLDLTDGELDHLSLAEALAYSESLFSDEEEVFAASEARRRSAGARRRRAPSSADRIAVLEREVKMLKAWVKKLADKLEDRPVPKPPAEKPRVVACEGKEEGEKCWFKKNPDDKMAPTNGKCTLSGKVMWCKPYDVPGPPKPKPPEEKPHVAACKDKEEGDKCWFKSNPNDKKAPTKGKCALSGKVLWCKPDDKPGPPEEKPHVVACKGKEEGEKCWFKSNPADKKAPTKGTCTLSGKVLWCKPVDSPGPKPPEEKPHVVACKGKEDGDKCSFWSATEDKMTPTNGTCTLTGKVMWCKPNESPDPKPPEEKPHVVACKGKEEGEKCWFGDKMAPIKGNCALSGKVLWCKPSEKPDIPAPARKACEGKKPGEKCMFVWQGGEKELIGKCTLSLKNETIVWCKPLGKPDGPPPAVAACKDKKADDECAVLHRPGMGPIMGKCVWSEKGDKKILWCKAKGLPPGPPKPPPAVAACADKKEDDDCLSAKPGTQPRKGKCTLSEKGDKKILWCKIGGGGSAKPDGRRRRRRQGR